MRTARAAVFARLLPITLSTCLAPVPLRAEAAMPPAALVEIYSGDGTVDAMAATVRETCASRSQDGLRHPRPVRCLIHCRQRLYGPCKRHEHSASSVTPTAITADDSGNCHVAGIYEGGALSDFGFSAPNGQRDGFGSTARIGYISVLTFDAASRPEWLSAQATLAAGRAFAATLYRQQGGAPIGQRYAAANPDALAAGQVRLSSNGTDQATISLPNGRIANIRRFRF